MSASHESGGVVRVALASWHLATSPWTLVEVRVELLGHLILVGVLLEEHLALRGAVSLALLDGSLALLVHVEEAVLGALAGVLLLLGGGEIGKCMSTEPMSAAFSVWSLSVAA